MNSEYIKQAMTKVGNPNVLINVVSRRVRQLTSGGGVSRPLIEQTATMGAADVALMELVEDKMAFSISSSTEEEEESQPAARKPRRRA